MKKLQLITLTCFTSLFLMNCTDTEIIEKTEDCTKNAIIQNSINVIIPAHNQTDGKTFFFIREVEKEVSCDFDETTVAKEIKDLPRLADFSYEVTDLVFTADTGKNNSNLKFNVKLSNLSDDLVGGLPYITIKEDGVLRSFAVNACEILEAKKDCSFVYNLNSELKTPAIKEVSVEKVEFLIIR